MDFLKEIKCKNILMLTIAGIINAIGVTIFISPVDLYDSGISGTSILLSQQTEITMSVFLVLLNIPIFIYGTKKQGKLFTIYEIYTVIIYSIGAWLINDVLPIDVTVASPIAKQDLLLCAVFGGMISGLGSGLAIRYGGAMDGIEVMAVIFAKKIGVSVGTFVMTYNALLYIVCGLLMQDWILPLYSIVTYYAGLKTIDFIVEGLDRAKSAMIITEHPTEICEALAYHFESGSTRINAIGGYSNREKTMIYFIVNRFQVTKMKNIVHEIDPQAFITISEVADVYSVNNK